MTLLSFHTIHRLRRATVMLLLLLSCTYSRSQELEYALELGAMGGTSFYLGDANYTSFYKNQHLAGALFARYNLNPRMSLKANLAYSKIGGDATLQENKFPSNPDTQWQFSHSLVDFSCQYEISFWGYGTGTGYKGHKRLTPYIQLGLGTMVAGGTFTANLPIGFGIKYKFKPRWNVGLDWTMRFTFSDKLDKISDPYYIPSGTLKNKDSYCLTMLYISYDLCPKYRKCNND